jgi:hypothetical protein
MSFERMWGQETKLHTQNIEFQKPPYKFRLREPS